jgi:hypothetical protein
MTTAKYLSGRNAIEIGVVPGSVDEQVPVKAISSGVTAEVG